MVEQCQNCLVAVSKLHIKCPFYSKYYYKDYPGQHKHNYSTYLERTDSTINATDMPNYYHSYVNFAIVDHLDVSPPILSYLLERMKPIIERYVIESNIIHQSVEEVPNNGVKTP